MMENTYSLSPLMPNDYAHALSLYEQAFPEEERRQSSEWIRLHESEQNFCICSIEEPEHFVGILGFWKFDDFVYIEHFATLPSFRGRGIGGVILRQFVYDNSPRPIVLEVEPAKNELASRRIAFYERLGFRLSPLSYIQPPYQKDGSSVPLCLMCTDTKYLSANFANVVRTLHTHVYGVKKC